MSAPGLSTTGPGGRHGADPVQVVKLVAALVGAVALTTVGFATARFVVEPAGAQSTKICSETCGPLTTSRADPATPRWRLPSP
jgi:hypothetical protein